MNIPLLSKIWEDNVSIIQNAFRRAIDGTVKPLFVDYTNFRVGIGTTSPTKGLHVSSTAQFETDVILANSTGQNITVTGTGLFTGNVSAANVSAAAINITSTASFRSDINVTGSINTLGATAGFRNVSYTWPSSNGAAGTVLANDGSGVLSWSAESSGGAAASAFNNLTATALTVAGTMTATGIANFLSTTNFNSDLNVTGVQTNNNYIQITLSLGSGTSTAAGNRMVSNAIYSDNIVKGWIIFDGTTATPTIKDWFNVDSLTDNAVGTWTINWGTDFSNSKYAIVGNTSAEGTNTFIVLDTTTFGTSAVKIYSVTSAGVTTDRQFVTAIAIGDQ